MTLGILASCESVVYITPELPDFELVRPERPVLQAIDGDAPREVIDNTLALMEYASKLEVVIDGWENFYGELRDVYNQDS